MHFSGAGHLRTFEVFQNYGISEEMFADMWLKARTVRTGRITILDDIKHDTAQLNEIYSRMVEGI